MHPFIESVIQELSMETDKTRILLERVPADKLEWKPHEKSMSIGQLALHIAKTPGDVAQMIQADTFDMKDMDKFNAKPAESKNQIIDAVDSNLQEFTSLVSDFDDNSLMTEWAFVQGDQPIFAAPRIAIIRSIICNHLYHHRGQLTVYLRLLDIPLPSIYGPSADDNPFT